MQKIIFATLGVVANWQSQILEKWLYEFCRKNLTKLIKNNSEYKK